MRNERLGPLDDPGEIADAELVRFEQGRRDGKPSWITKRTGKRRPADRSIRPETLLTKALGNWRVKAEQIAPIVGHPDILTTVGMTSPSHESGPNA